MQIIFFYQMSNLVLFHLFFDISIDYFIMLQIHYFVKIYLLLMNLIHQFLLEQEILFVLDDQKIIFYLYQYFVNLPNLIINLFTFYFLLAIMELLSFFIFNCQIDIYYLLFRLHHLISLINHLNLYFYYYQLFEWLHSLQMKAFMLIFQVNDFVEKFFFHFFGLFDHYLGKENHS